MKKFILLVIVAVFLSNVTAFAYDIPAKYKTFSLSGMLTRLKLKFEEAFNQFDKDMKATVDEVSRAGIKGDEAREILREFQKKTGLFAIYCITADTEGKIVIVEPEKYSIFENSDISSKVKVLELLKNKKPVISDVFTSVAGLKAIDFEYPVLSQDAFIGSLSLLIDPEKLLSGIIEPLVKDMPFDVWVMQRDGTVIYDFKKKETGKNLLNDPMYKPFRDFISFYRNVIQEDSGVGRFESLDIKLDEPVVKNALWTSIGIHGLVWRIVVSEREK